MITLLSSNLNPLKTQNPSFYETFYSLLGKAKFVRIGVGFITQDSLAELIQIINLNGKPIIELIIGMHHFHGFEKPQLNASINLNALLQKNKLGGVFVSTSFQYHGKVYLFVDHFNKPFACIIGSDNLGSIVQTTNRIYESSVLIEEPLFLKCIDYFMRDLQKICESVEGLNTKINNSSAPLENVSNVTKIISDNLIEYVKESSGKKCFLIPLKANQSPKSNLNAYFGKGRLNSKTDLIKPRPWYEVELIVPSKITRDPDYPTIKKNNGIFTVITDDGWKFDCKVSGDYNKNLRSEGNLSILGRWIKGRLENDGVLVPGERITDEMLKKYGRNTIDLIKLDDPDKWLLTFNKLS